MSLKEILEILKRAVTIASYMAVGAAIFIILFFCWLIT